MKLDKGGGVSEAVDTSSSKKTATPDENGTEKEREQSTEHNYLTH